MTERKLMFTLWDVGHGVALWIKTPNDSNHWIDLVSCLRNAFT